jgi:hypothetical protein
MKIAAIGGGITKYCASRIEIGSVPLVAMTTAEAATVMSTGPQTAGWRTSLGKNAMSSR